jgi:hypothetical protein
MASTFHHPLLPLITKLESIATLSEAERLAVESLPVRVQALRADQAGDIPDLQSLHIPVMDHSLATMTQATVAFIPHEAVRDLTARFPNITAVL